ncbi:MAG: hypothetical protein C0408_05060 [Odoribacter sp.]|nr:hypothetical protein [Odoribacter sp.]
MVLTEDMRKFANYIFLIALLFIFSCEEQVFFVNCKDCHPEEPMEISLDVKLNRFTNDPYNAVVKVFEGSLEDNILKATYYVTVNDLIVKVNINKKYTLTATYIKNNGSTYTAVDSTTPRVKYEADLCEKPCYYVYNKKIDLRLKYL